MTVRAAGAGSVGYSHLRHLQHVIRITELSVLQLSAADSLVKPAGCLCGTVYVQVVQKLPVVMESESS
jgi:hypothetical protein